MSVSNDFFYKCLPTVEQVFYGKIIYFPSQKTTSYPQCYGNDCRKLRVNGS